MADYREKLRTEISNFEKANGVSIEPAMVRDLCISLAKKRVERFLAESFSDLTLADILKLSDQLDREIHSPDVIDLDEMRKRRKKNQNPEYPIGG